MKDPNEKIMQYIIVGLFFIVAFLTILFITQDGKHAVDKASEMTAEAQGTLKDIGQKFVDATKAERQGTVYGTSIGQGGAP